MLYTVEEFRKLGKMKRGSKEYNAYEEELAKLLRIRIYVGRSICPPSACCKQVEVCVTIYEPIVTDSIEDLEKAVEYFRQQGFTVALEKHYNPKICGDKLYCVSVHVSWGDEDDD